MAAERSTQARPVCKAFESIRKHLPACLLACLLARAFACLRVCAPVCFWCQTIVWQEYSFGKTGSGQTQTRHPFHPSAGCIVVLRRFKTLPRSLNCATTGALFNADHLVHLQVVGRVVGIALLHGESTVFLSRFIPFQNDDRFTKTGSGRKQERKSDPKQTPLVS